MRASETYRLHRGQGPLLISIPHSGTMVPKEIAERFSKEAAPLPDTDWHVNHLYGFATELNASILIADTSRYVIDLNRPPTDESLYPGQATTGLIPMETFTGKPLYNPGMTPDPSEKEIRVRKYWAPYHQALQEELDRIRTRHGHAVLWDAHSILSRIPMLFGGTLPDFNIGTNDGFSCDPSLARAVFTRAHEAEGYTAILNGRFKGGFITRHYGNPAAQIHALQLELSQRTYMEEYMPWHYRTDLAQLVQPHLTAMLEICCRWPPS